MHRATLADVGWAQKKARKRVYDPLLIKEKVSRIAFDAELKVTAVLPTNTRPQRANELLAPAPAAYRHYDNPAGARLNVSQVRPVVPDPSILHLSGPGLFGKRSVVGVREAACLWHSPGAGGEDAAAHGAQRPGRRPCRRHHDRHAPEDPLPRHHLYVARTRMGKSTLMHHIVHKMREKAEGRDGDAIVVVDPHADLVGGLLEHVPDSLIDSARRQPAGHPHLLLTATAPPSRWCGRGQEPLGPFGPRMQSILEQTVKSLHEANEQMDAGEQYTILDGLRLLADEEFRSKVLEKVNDP